MNTRLELDHSKESLKLKDSDQLKRQLKSIQNLHPKRRFDFSQTSGVLYLGHPRQVSHDFRWKQKDGKYSLDEEYTFNHLNGYGKRDSFTFLVITAEVIRLKAWRILGYSTSDSFHGQFEEFCEAFPLVRERESKALYDFWVGEMAYKRKMTANELMRMRLLRDLKDYRYD